MGEETLHGEYVYRGKIINLKVNQVRLPNKNVAIREIVEHPGAAVIVALDDQRRLLMVRQYRSAAGRDLLEVPAGTLNHGEAPAFCAIRELKEETGYQASQWEPLGYCYPSPGFSTEKMHFYFAQGLTQTDATPEEDEEIAVEWVPFVQAVEMIESGEIVDAKTIVGIHKASKRLNR